MFCNSWSQNSCHNNFLCLYLLNMFWQFVKLFHQFCCDTSFLFFSFFFLMFYSSRFDNLWNYQIKFAMLISNLCTWCVVWYLFSHIINFFFGKIKPFNFHMWWYEMWWYEKLLHMKSLPHPKPIQKDNLWNLELFFPPKLTPMYHPSSLRLQNAMLNCFWPNGWNLNTWMKWRWTWLQDGIHHVMKFTTYMKNDEMDKNWHSFKCYGHMNEIKTTTQMKFMTQNWN